MTATEPASSVVPAQGEVLLAGRGDALTDPAFYFVVLPVGILTLFLVEVGRKRAGAEKTRGWRAFEYVSMMTVGGAAYVLAKAAGIGT